MSVTADTSEVLDLAADLATAGAKAAVVQTVALNESSQMLRATALAAAPRDTGELAASIYVRVGPDSRTVGSDVKQGFFQEYGTSRHPPQPWLFAYGDRAGEAMATILGKVEPL